jgi:octaprenyl-diphosphate synthase
VIRDQTATHYAPACELREHNANGPRPLAAAAPRNGQQVGIAFQIVADRLDLEGDEDEVGKSLGTDLEKGKLTLPVIKLLRDLPARDRKELQELLSSRNGVDKKTAVLKMIRERDILAYCTRRATEFVEDAKAGLRRLPDSIHVDALVNLADFVLDRRV